MLLTRMEHCFILIIRRYCEDAQCEELSHERFLTLSALNVH